MEARSPVDEEKLKDLAKAAVNAAASVPAEYRAAAFRSVFDYLLRQADSSLDSPQPRPTRLAQAGGLGLQAAVPERVQKLLQADSKALQNFSFMANLREVRYLVLGVLKFAKDYGEMEGLSEGEIRDVLLQKFRINVTHGTLSGTLHRIPISQVNRIPTAGRMHYSLMGDGEVELQKVLGRLAPNKLPPNAGAKSAPPGPWSNG